MRLPIKTTVLLVLLCAEVNVYGEAREKVNHSLKVDYSIAHYAPTVRGDSIYIAAFDRFNGDMYLYCLSGDSLNQVQHWPVRLTLPSNAGAQIFELTPQLELLIDTWDTFSLLDLTADLGRTTVDDLTCPNQSKKRAVGFFSGDQSSYFVYHDYCYERWVWAIDNSIRQYGNFRTITIGGDGVRAPVSFPTEEVDRSNLRGIVRGDTLFAVWEEHPEKHRMLHPIMFATFADGNWCEPYVVTYEEDRTWPGLFPLGLCRIGERIFVFWCVFDSDVPNTYFYSWTTDYEYWSKPRSLDEGIVNRLPSYESFQPSGPSSEQSDGSGLYMLLRDGQDPTKVELFFFDGQQWENLGLIIDEQCADRRLMRHDGKLYAFWLGKLPNIGDAGMSGDPEATLPKYELHYSRIEFVGGTGPVRGGNRRTEGIGVNGSNTD